MLIGQEMQPVAVRSRDAEPIPVAGGSRVYEWHIAHYELRDPAGKLAGYRSYCGLQVRAVDAILEPGRIGAFHQECAEYGRLPKYR